MTNSHYRQARLARDHRFDGRFFVAVKTTGIYCRPICPAPAPKERNVLYFDSAIAAANAGFRPCLRCRPDSAPTSWAWMPTAAPLMLTWRRSRRSGVQCGRVYGCRVYGIRLKPAFAPFSGSKSVSRPRATSSPK
ncbi:Ada metal-binding domain-containing protein [Marinimicrobium koreense]|uniref:Ada metal-binding domain-containing protein n=1 Tax=Marinimicrobium koreense TaxID=306545 RepID=UPI003F71EC87